VPRSSRATANSRVGIVVALAMTCVIGGCSRRL
jgi:hypothetical protein